MSEVINEQDRPYRIGIYDHYNKIPPGTWGYLTCDLWPGWDFAGPYYVMSPDEQAALDYYNSLLEAEMTQYSAPTTLEMLLELASDNLQDPRKIEEKARIIGSRISLLYDDWVKSGRIDGLRTETDGRNETLFVHLSSTSAGGPGWDQPADHKPAEWYLPIRDISNYSCNTDIGFPYAITFNFKGDECVINRNTRDPRVKEAYKNASALIGGERSRFLEVKASGDFDPGLTAYFQKLAEEDVRLRRYIQS